MKKAKLLIIASIIFVVAGALSFVVAFAGVGWDIKKLSTTTIKYSTVSASNTDLDLAGVNKIDFDGSTFDVQISYGAELSVTYPEIFTRGGKPAVKIKTTVKNGVLYISSSTNWLRTFGIFSFDSGKAEIVLPRDRNVDLSIEVNTGDVKFIGDASTKTDYVFVETSTGNVTMQDVIAETIKIEVDTGDAKLLDSRCEFAEIEGDTGNVKITGSQITSTEIETDTGDVKIKDAVINSAKIETDTGDVRLEDSAMAELTVRTSTGDVNIVGNVCATKAKIRTSTGDVSGKSAVLDTNEIRITTSTGDVKLTLKGKISDFSFLINVSTGDSNVGSMVIGDKVFEAKVSTGDVKLYFTE